MHGSTEQPTQSQSTVVDSAEFRELLQEMDRKYQVQYWPKSSRFYIVLQYKNVFFGISSKRSFSRDQQDIQQTI